MTAQQIAERIERSIPGARAEVSGDEAHFSAVVVSDAFQGKTRVEQHQMIYSLFRKEMTDQTIHALALRTLTPQQEGGGRAPAS